VVMLCLVKDEPTVCDQCLSGECGRTVGNEEGHRSRRVGRRQPARFTVAKARVKA
jgi:hypothetical protein